MRNTLLLLPLMLAACGHAASAPAQPTTAKAPAAATADQDVFVDPVVGFSIRRPTGWSFASRQTIQENREGISFGDPKFDQAVRERARLPLVAIRKFPEEIDGINPTLQVVLRPLPTELAGATPLQVGQTMLAGMAAVVPSLVIEEPPSVTQVSGHEAVHYVVRFELTGGDGRSWLVKARSWIVPLGKNCYIIGMSGPTEGPNVSDPEFAAALASIAIR